MFLQGIVFSDQVPFLLSQNQPQNPQRNSPKALEGSMERYGKIWKDMERYGKIWKDMERYGRYGKIGSPSKSLSL